MKVSNDARVPLKGLVLWLRPVPSRGVKHRVTGLGRSCSIETPLTLPRTGFDTRQAKTLDISESR